MNARGHLHRAQVAGSAEGDQRSATVLVLRDTLGTLEMAARRHLSSSYRRRNTGPARCLDAAGSA